MEVQAFDVAIDSLPQINIIDIKIQKSFRNGLPHPYKINKCYAHYRRHRKFEGRVVLNKDMELVDGYVTYLVAKMLDIETVPVTFWMSKEDSDATQ